MEYREKFPAWHSLGKVSATAYDGRRQAPLLPPLRMTKKRLPDPAPEATVPSLSLEKAEKGPKTSMWELLLQLRVLLPYLARLVPLLDRGMVRPGPDLTELTKGIAEMQTGSRDLEVQARNQALQLERIEQQMARLRVVHENSMEESRTLTTELAIVPPFYADHRHGSGRSPGGVCRDDCLPGGPSLESRASFPQVLMGLQLIFAIQSRFASVDNLYRIPQPFCCQLSLSGTRIRDSSVQSSSGTCQISPTKSFQASRK